MEEAQFKALAHKIVNYSLNLEPGSKVYLDVNGLEERFLYLLLEQIHNVGAQPFIQSAPKEFFSAMIPHSSEQQLKLMAKHELYRLRSMDAYLGVLSYDNFYEHEDLPEEKLALYMRHYERPKLWAMTQLNKWLLLAYPTQSLAQQAKMSIDSFKEVYFSCCNMDYMDLRDAAEPLVKLLEQTSEVRIVAPHTHLTFSIENMPVIVGDGHFNLPDGEVFTTPILESVEGEILFNIPTSYRGLILDSLHLRFKDGKIIDLKSEDNARVWGLLNEDEGAKRVGEFGIGINYHIKHPVNHILFDEKMSGSLHLALGQAYEKANNGNVSSIHWDLIQSHDEIYGGGELYFDNKLIRRNGYFLHPDLEQLNK